MIQINYRPVATPVLPEAVDITAQFPLYDWNQMRFVPHYQLTWKGSLREAHILMPADQDPGVYMRKALEWWQAGNNRGMSPLGYHTCNSSNIFQELSQGLAFPCLIGRTGIYTEHNPRNIVQHLTGGRIQPSRMQMLMAHHPAMVLDYHPGNPDSFCRIKPSWVPPGVTMKYATAFGTRGVYMLLAGKIMNRWSDAVQKDIYQDVSVPLIITEGEKKAFCLAQLPLFSGIRLDVVGIPGVWMWGMRNDDTWQLAEPLSSYTYNSGGQARDVVLVFDVDQGYKPGVVDALCQLHRCLTERGARVYLGRLPLDPAAKGVDDFFRKHCFPAPDLLDWRPVCNVLDQAELWVNPYFIKYPPLGMNGRWRLLLHYAFWQMQHQVLLGEALQKHPDLVSHMLGALALCYNPEYPRLFQKYTAERQSQEWMHYVKHNVFLQALHEEITDYIPEFFRQPSAKGERWNYLASHSGVLSGAG